VGMTDRVAAVGESAAREAGALLLARFRTGVTVHHKGEIDLVTEADLASEELVVSRLLGSFPGHVILAEEKHAVAERGEFTWIVDPLDGTTNFAHGFPAFAVSIALEHRGELVWGVVHNPILDETFTAERGCGAALNGQAIRVSVAEELGDSLMATGFPYDVRTSRANNLDFFCAIVPRVRGIRRAGSAALDLAYVAAGRLDGFWELKLGPWDCAAGYLLVREAGGRVTDFQGRDGSIHDRECVASNGLIHDEMLTVLGSARPGC